MVAEYVQSSFNTSSMICASLVENKNIIFVRWDDGGGWSAFCRSAHVKLVGHILMLRRERLRRIPFGGRVVGDTILWKGLLAVRTWLLIIQCVHSRRSSHRLYPQPSRHKLFSITVAASKCFASIVNLLNLSVYDERRN